MNLFLINQPIITEKSLLMAQTRNAYTFEVERHATKEQIKAMIEKLYNVDVLSVNTILGHKDLKATGRRRLKRLTAKVKKAVITLKPGQKIELFDITGGEAA